MWNLLVPNIFASMLYDQDTRDVCTVCTESLRDERVTLYKVCVHERTLSLSQTYLRTAFVPNYCDDTNTNGCLRANFAVIRRCRSISINLSSRFNPSSFNRSINMDRRSDLANNGKLPFHSGKVRM